MEPMRQSGEWLPSGADWVVSHVASYGPVLGYAYLSAGDFKDTQAMNIISVEQPDYTACESTGEYIFLYLNTTLQDYEIKPCRRNSDIKASIMLFDFIVVSMF
ncbi:MAG: hypothetical protein HFH33_11260, partial [Eubacterium sp.]|nr:hypothetical protein [Eubacterium sp.]